MAAHGDAHMAADGPGSHRNPAAPYLWTVLLVALMTGVGKLVAPFFDIVKHHASVPAAGALQRSALGARPLPVRFFFRRADVRFLFRAAYPQLCGERHQVYLYLRSLSPCRGSYGHARDEDPQRAGKNEAKGEEDACSLCAERADSEQGGPGMQSLQRSS